MDKWGKFPRSGQRGVTMLMVMTVISALILATVLGVGMHQSAMRTTGFLNRQILLNGCARQGLIAGSTFFLSHPEQWNNYLDTGYVLTGQPYKDAPTNRPDLIYIAGISDNVDEFPPQQNEPLIDHDQRVILRSQCTDSAAQQHEFVQAVLTLENLRPGGGLPAQAGAVTYTKTADFTNNGALSECNGCGYIGHDTPGGASQTGEGGAGAVLGNQGITALGVRLSHDEITLAEQTAYPFLWLPGSAEGTISKINTLTGQEIARYRTAPLYGNPSRTTVDLDGNVWVSNRNIPDAASPATITKIGLLEAGGCADRNGDGVITTSRGAADVKAWGRPNQPARWLDGVELAQDECILLYVPLVADGVTPPKDARMLAIDSENNLYAGGSTSTAVFHIRGTDGAILRARHTRQGHYGGVLDRSGDIWSMLGGSGKVEKIRADLSSSQLFPIGHPGYAVNIDINGRIWTSSWTPAFSRLNPDGTDLRVFQQTQDGGVANPNVGCCAQGITSNADGDVFLAGSLTSNHIGHYRNDGSFVRNYLVGAGPTGVVVDAAGKIWAAGYTSRSISRIDPRAGVVEATYVTGVHSYTYSDATGYVVRTMTSPQGTWTVTQYCGRNCPGWATITWDAEIFQDTDLRVRARSAPTVGTIATANWVDVTARNGERLPNNLLPGPVVQVEVRLTRTLNTNRSPVVYALTLEPR